MLVVLARYVRPMEPLVLSSSIAIPAPPESVWAVLADVPRWPAWCPPVRRITRFTALEPGLRMAYVLAMGPGIPVSFDVLLQTVDRPRCLQWTSTKWWGVRGTRAFSLEATDAGTTITDHKTFESRIWPVAALYPRSTVSSMSDGWLEGLYDEVLARAPR